MNYLVLAYVLITVGLLILVAELFIPSGGLLTVCSAACIIGGVAMTFIYGDPSIGLVTMITVFLAVPILVGFGFYYWPKTPIGKRLIQKGTDEDATLATMPVNLELEQLRGRIGRAVSSLRPSGVVDFDGRRIDTITEGMMVDPGTWVRCIDVKSGKVIVRPVDKPPSLDDLEHADFT